MYDRALTDLRNLYRGGVSENGWAGSAGKEDVLRWAEVGNLSVTAVLDQVGIGLAQDYSVGIFTWGFCDAVANDLFSALTDLHLDPKVEVDEPKQFWKFYLAFDHSETVPAEEAEQTAHEQIAEFLSELRVRS